MICSQEESRTIFGQRDGSRLVLLPLSGIDESARLELEAAFAERIGAPRTEAPPA